MIGKPSFVKLECTLNLLLPSCSNTEVVPVRFCSCTCLKNGDISTNEIDRQLLAFRNCANTRVMSAVNVPRIGH